MLVIHLLIALLSFGNDSIQSEFPKKIIIGTDTCLAFTNDQVIEMNKEKIDFETCKQENSIRTNFESKQDTMIGKLSAIVTKAETSDSLSRLEVRMLADLNKITQEKFADINQSWKTVVSDVEKSVKKKIVKFAAGFTTVTVVFTVAAVVVFHYLK